MSTDSSKILVTKNLVKYYGTGENQVRALDGIDLTVEQGEFLAVVGTSGSGKSTLLHMLGGLDRPTSGKVYVDGKDVEYMDRLVEMGYKLEIQEVPATSVSEYQTIRKNWRD